MRSPGFVVVGHRGAAARAPENTAPSFELAVAAGVHAVELDVQLTKDDRALVHHDPTLRRVCGFDGVVRELTLDRCRRLHVRSSFRQSQTWRRVRMLSLDEALSILRPDVEVHVELKGEPGHGEALARDVINALRRTGGFAGALVTSSVPSLILEVAHQAPEVSRGLVYPSRPAFDLEEVCAKLQPSVVVPNRIHITRTFVRQMHAKERQILPYTVNTRHELLRVRRLGVEGVITDNPERAIQWLQSEKDTPAVRRRSPQRKKPPILAIDLGSSDIKVALVGPNGEPLQLIRKPLPTLHGPRGEIGLDAEALERSVSRTAIRMIRDSGEAVDTMTLASQRSTFVLWDKRRGKPIGDAPSWRCLRGTRICAARKSASERVRHTTGLRLAPSYSASKIAWKLRKIGATSRPLLCGPLPTYLLWRWSNGRLFSTEPTLAARTLLMRLSNRQWDDELLDLFNIPRNLLPEIGDTSGDLGEISWGERTLKVRCQVGDQQAALMAFSPGDGEKASPRLSLNLGTGAFLLLPTGPDLRRVNGLLSSVARTEGDEVEYLAEGTVHRVVPSLLGFARDHGLDLIGLAEMIARAKNDAFMLPAQEGLGSPFWDPRRRTVVRGSREPSSRARALFESLAFLVRENYLLMRRLLPGLDSITVGGGLSRNPHLLQLLSDTLAIPVHVSSVQESTITGAALLAMPKSARSAARRSGGSSLRLPIEPRRTVRQAARRHREWRDAVLR